MDATDLIEPSRTQGERPRVLIVEPNRSYLAVLARRISAAGYRVTTAADAHAAIAELHRAPTNCLLSELGLKGTTGVELVRIIRDDPVHHDLPLILMGGRSEATAAVRALQAGADDVVRKPFDFDVLVARIGRQIDRARSVNELRVANAALDARVVTRAIELGEMRDRWVRSEAERRRLEALVRQAA